MKMWYAPVLVWYEKKKSVFSKKKKIFNWFDCLDLLQGSHWSIQGQSLGCQEMTTQKISHQNIHYHHSALTHSRSWLIALLTCSISDGGEYLKNVAFQQDPVWQVLVQKCPSCACCAADFLPFLACHSDETGTRKKLTACIAQGQTYLKMACSLMWPTGLKEWGLKRFFFLFFGWFLRGNQYRLPVCRPCTWWGKVEPLFYRMTG